MIYKTLRTAPQTWKCIVFGTDIAKFNIGIPLASDKIVTLNGTLAFMGYVFLLIHSSPSTVLGP